MCEPFLAAVRLLAIWLACALVFCGLGFHVRRLFGLRGTTVHGVFLAFWSGWVLTLVILQVWHLWFPVDVRALVPIAVLGAVGVFRERAAITALFSSWKTLGGEVLLGLGIAALALGPMRYFDTGFYHLTTVEWIRTYPIVPGLGNLHGRLAFNSSFYLYAALLETLWTDGARYLANGLLMFVLLLQVLGSSVRYLRARWGQGDAPHLPGLVSVLLLGPIAAQVLGPSLSSLSSDMPVFALGIVVTLSVVRLAARPPGSSREGHYRISTIILLVAGGLAVKLSFLVYGGLVGILALAFWWRSSALRGTARSRTEGLAALGLTAALAVAVLVPWTVRSVYLSGYAVYPGGHVPVEVDWRVPRSLALEDARFIYGMARSRSDHWAETLGNRSWLERWWRELPGDTTRHLAVTVLAILALLARLVQRPWRDPPPDAAALGLVVLASLASLAWWFSTAPDPRFAGALFAILAAGLAALALPKQGKPGIDLVAAAVFLGALAIPTYDSVYRRAYCRPPDWDYVTRTTDSGLAVHVPAEGIQCWKIPLPATPYFRPSLSPRRPGDLGHGFFLEETVTLADMEEGSIPLGFRLSPDLGIHLVSGWRRLELSDNRRVLSGAGRMLLFTERSTRARMRLSVRSIALRGEPLERCQLRVLVGGAPVHRTELRPGVPVELEISLARDFNDVVLEVSTGGEPDEDYGVFQPSRRIEVTFDQVEIMSNGVA